MSLKGHILPPDIRPSCNEPYAKKIVYIEYTRALNVVLHFLLQEQVPDLGLSVFFFYRPETL